MNETSYIFSCQPRLACAVTEPPCLASVLGTKVRLSAMEHCCQDVPLRTCGSNSTQ